MHRNGPGTSCTTFSGDNGPGRSDWSAGMGPIACGSAGRRVCASDALEDQGLALRLTDLWQAEGGSQRGRPTRVGKLTDKMVRFGRRVPGLTFGTTMTTSSAPVRRPGRPRSRQPESLGCRPGSTGFSPHVPCFLQEDVLESPLLGGYIKAGLDYIPAQVAASRRTLQPRTRARPAPSAPFQP